MTIFEKLMLFSLLIYMIIKTNNAGGDPILICYSQLNSHSDRLQYYNPYSQSPSFQSPAKPQHGNYGSFQATIESKEIALDNKKNECEKKNAIFLDPVCVKFVVPELTFEDARAFCISIGADLWIPNLTDPYLFQNLAKHFPVVFGGSNHTVWIGVTLLDGRFITIEGDDVTTTYLGLMGNKEGDNGNCVFLHMLGGLTLGNSDCLIENDFVCQIKLEGKGEKFYKKTLKYF